MLDDGKDPAPLFLNQEIQSLLSKLTRVDLKKVYRKRKLQNKRLSLPEVKFLTDDQLQKILEENNRKVKDILQMPPVLKVREKKDEVISNDVGLKDHDTAKYVFTDITFGIKNVDRFILVREMDGRLMHADWPLRDRMIQLYFPLEGRKLTQPLLFGEPYFTDLLSRKEHLFLLDEACLQFEPNDYEYQRVTSVTYQHIDNNCAYETIRSTRHFGPFTFFLTWFKMIDSLLLDLIKTQSIDEAGALLQLFEKINNLNFRTEASNDIQVIEKYIENFSTKKAQLELALTNCKNILQERKDLEEGIKQAHGLSSL